MTNYVVLHKSGENIWTQFSAINARSARSAISQALEGGENPYKEGQFTAVPARSWRPVQVKVETKTALKFS
jgi:hypothetical protein